MPPGRPSCVAVASGLRRLVLLARARGRGPRGAGAAVGASAARADSRRGYGSGAFGRWFVDRFGLPAYRYRIDEERDPRARSRSSRTADPPTPGTSSATTTSSPTAYNHGYAQLWSQDRVYQWANRYSSRPTATTPAATATCAPAGGRSARSTPTARPARATERVFGTGYFAAQRCGRRARRSTSTSTRRSATTPLLLHDVTIRNRTRSAARGRAGSSTGTSTRASRAEARQRGLGRAALGRRRAHPVASRQARRGAGDRRPLRIFAAALRGPVAGHETDAARFFGAGGRARPGRGGGRPAGRPRARRAGGARAGRAHALRLPRAGRASRPAPP